MMDQYRRRYDWGMPKRPCHCLPPIHCRPRALTGEWARGCFWLDYVDGIVDVVKAPQTWLEALELWRSEQPMETLERPWPASEVAWVASEAV
jgi:hypothetical protein